MKSFTCLVLFLTLVVFCSCRDKRLVTHGEFETIGVNPDESIGVNLREIFQYTSKKVFPEMTENSLLSYVEEVEFYDDKIFLYDKHRVLAFDTLGAFLFSVGRKGLGPGEYLDVSSFFIKDDKVWIYDSDALSLLVYDLDGKYLETKKTEVGIASLYPMDKDRFVGKRKYQGGSVKTPILEILSKNLIPDLEIKNRFFSAGGVGTFDYCSSFDNQILYWEFLNDTIFHVIQSNILPRYYVDFQKRAIPASSKRDKSIGEIIEYINSNNSRFASGVRYVQEDSAHVRFIFTYKEHINYARYDKEAKKVSLAYFYDPEEILETQYFMKFENGNIILSVYDLEDYSSNPYLLFVSENELFKETLPTLSELSEQR